MEQKLYKTLQVSAPGSLMLLGEHAVLDKKQAIVCAIDKRISIQLTQLAEQTDNTKKVFIKSDSLGEFSSCLDDLTINSPYEYVISAILIFKNQIKHSFSLEISSDFSESIGFGSSAAVTAATIAILAHWVYAKPFSEQVIFQQAKKAILQVHTVASCADLAASIYGGVLSYKMDPLKVESLPSIPELSAIYCGYKKPTHQVIALVNAAKNRQPKVYESIFRSIEECVKQAVLAIKKQDWSGLGQLFMHHQGLLAAIGVSNELLDTLVHQLCNQEKIQGAKISGSGLGDCIIGLGALQEKIFPLNEVQAKQGIVQFAVRVSEQGLAYEQ